MKEIQLLKGGEEIMKRGFFLAIALLIAPVAILNADKGTKGLGEKIKREVCEAIKEDIEEEGFLGVYVEDLSKAQKKAIGVDHGVFIKDIVEDSPADSAGVKAGDVVIAIDGEKIEDKDEFNELIDEKPGELVELTILREGQELKLQAKLGEKETVKRPSYPETWSAPWESEAATEVMGVAKMGVLMCIIAIIMTFLIPIMWFYFNYRKRVWISKERIAAIEKGVALPPEPIRPVRTVAPMDILRRGFICIAIGVALTIATVVTEIKWPLIGGSLVILFIGIALVIWYRIAIRKEGSRNL